MDMLYKIFRFLEKAITIVLGVILAFDKGMEEGTAKDPDIDANGAYIGNDVHDQRHPDYLIELDYELYEEGF